MAGFFSRLLGGSRGAEARRAERAASVERLLHPKWDVVNTALGREAPQVLHELYADTELVMSGDFRVHDPAHGGDPARAWYVNYFVPAEEEAVVPQLESFPAGAFAFAINVYGDPYYVQIGELPNGDGRVYVHYHDGDDTELVAPSLATFLDWRRETA